jgi:hypothetical protein
MGQDQEDSLKGILRVVRASQHALADAQDHRTMTGHQLLKGGLGRLVMPGDEPVEELSVGHRADRSQVEQSAHLPKHPAR